MSLFGPKKCTEGGVHHKYQPRYDEESQLPKGFKCEGEVPPKVLNAMKAKQRIYVRDVCVWCGKTIERE
jgi:hypothetical protein